MPTRTTFGTRAAFGGRASVADSARAASIQQLSPAVAPVAAETVTWPFLTVGLAAFLVAVFVLELRWRVDPLPNFGVSLRDSVALGGVGPYYVFHEHEWWRIFTAPFLHGSVSHLLGNIVALIFAGVTLERMLGRAWLAALFMLGALGGSIGSLIYSNAVAGVGASGALMCLVTVLFALSHHYAAGDRAPKLRRRALFVVVSAFLPSAAPGAPQIDYGAHFGGFAVGIVCGFILLILWPDDSPRPPLRGAALGIALLCIVATCFAAFEVSTRYPIYVAKNAALIPSALEATDPAGAAKRSGEFVARYPHDPLGRLLQGTTLFNDRDYGDAEDEARTGLAEKENLDLQYAPVVRERLELLLTMSLWGAGKHDEAKAGVARFCASTSSDEFIRNGRGLLYENGLCR